MIRRLVIRGLVAGLLAGLVVFTVAKVFGEPQVDRAIAFEGALEAAKAKISGVPAAPEPELVTRGVQASWGLLTGVIVYCTALGGVFALVFAAVHRRLTTTASRGTAAIIAAAGFICLSLVPQLKYPANPPAVGEPETIGFRTMLYLGFLLFSVGLAVVAAATRVRLSRHQSDWTAALVAVAIYVVGMMAVAAVLPALNEIPEAFPAVVLWNFRVAALGMQMVMWAALGLIFGVLAEPLFDAPSTLGRSTHLDWRSV